MEKEIKAYSLEELAEAVRKLGQPRFRADQLIQWLYVHGVNSYGEMTNLPLAFRKTLEEKYPLHFPEIINRQISKDGTRKYVLRLADNSLVETVAIPSYDEEENNLRGLSSDEEDDSSSKTGAVPPGEIVAIQTLAATKIPKRLTVCFSTQIGCAMACTFCATGKEGFSRNLLPGEIVDQVLVVQKDFGFRVSNLVAMGQGEPFLNYDNTLAALRIMNSPKGLAIGARHITISTCGIIKSLERFALEPEQFTLAISLHSAQQKVRDSLMPKLASEPLGELKKALQNYISLTNRRITLEYIMIDGVNDTKEALSALTSFCSDLLCHVNLIPLNTVSEQMPDTASIAPSLRPSSASTLRYWLSKLEEKRIPATIRQSKGSDIAGACGQLKNTL